MNARILELIKNPAIIQNQDLDLLNSEVNKHPYLQNIRALHLIATHQFNIENYQKELSLTAAYTTDKKILYQLINKKTENISVKEVATETILETPKIKVEANSSIFEEIEIEPKPTAKPVLVEGVLNRILFEGEEDFLERETAKIDLGSTLESGQIVTQKIIKKESTISENKICETNKSTDYQTVIPTENIKETEIDIQEEVTENASEISFHETAEFLPDIQIDSNKVDSHQKQTAENIDNEDNNHLKEKDSAEIKDAVNLNTETIVNETKIAQQEEIIETSSEISFHGSEEFLPEVQIKSNSYESTPYKLPQQKLSKQEEEMQRLIAQVEAKVKASKKETTKEIEIVENSDINFSSTQEFNIEASNKEEVTNQISVEVEKESSSIIEEKTADLIQHTPQIKEIQPKSENSSWKPMQLFTTIPDALIEKKAEIKTESSISTGKITDNTSNQKSEERPVFNVSFFTPQVSSIETKKEETSAPKIESEEKIQDVNSESNIPVFINTWQNWLKIERKEEVSEQKPLISKEEVKNNVIEKFIEKEPKISKLKEESDFIVKEKSSNISHLMTETLANLYVEQKLFSKAIKAYETLIEKHPKKERLFQEKIQEIKDLRKNT